MSELFFSCKHYFCSECALKRYKKTARCYACTADTKGFFKFASDLPARLSVIRAKRKKSDIWSDSDQDENEHSGGCCNHSKHKEEQSNEENNGCFAEDDSEHNDKTDTCENKLKLPAPAEPKWAQPEALEFCDSDEESD